MSEAMTTDLRPAELAEEEARWREALRRGRGVHAPLVRGWVADRAEAADLALAREDALAAELPQVRTLPVDVRRVVYAAYALGWRDGRRASDG